MGNEGNVVFFIILVIALIGSVILFSAIINTSKNTESLRKNPYAFFHQRFAFFISIGDREAAKQLLIDRIRVDKNFTKAFGKRSVPGAREIIEKTYKPQLDILGITIDWQAVNDYYYNV